MNLTVLVLLHARRYLQCPVLQPSLPVIDACCCWNQCSVIYSFSNMSVSYSCRSPIKSGARRMCRSHVTFFCDGHSQIYAVLYTHMSSSCPVPRSPHLMCRRGAIVHIVLLPPPCAAVLESAAPGVADDVGASCKGDCSVGSARRIVSFQFGSFAGV